MNPKAFPELLGRIHELSPRQREQLRGALAAPAANSAPAPAPESGPEACPHCGAQSPRRFGQVRGQQRWRCQACKRTFGLNAGSPLLGLHRKTAWKTFRDALNEGLTMRGAAERCGIHRDTASRWRRRALAAPAEVQPPAAAPQRPPARTAADPRTRRTREALRRALLTLMGRKQFADVTVRDIAAEAGIGYATFFRHHASKVELLNEVAAEQIGRLGAMTLNQVEGADPRQACLLLCRYVAMQRPLWYALLTGGAAATLRREFVRLASAHGHVRNSEWLPVELGATHGVAATIEILAWWLRHPAQQSAEQVADVLDRLVLQPLLAGSFPRAA